MDKRKLYKEKKIYDEHCEYFSESKKRIIYPKKIYCYNCKTNTYEKFKNSLEIEGEMYYVNKNAPYFIKFNRNVNSDEIFCIRKNNYYISVLSPMSSKSVKLEKDREGKDTVIFDGMIRDYQILCNVNGGSVNTKLIISNEKENYNFDIVLRCKNLFCEQDECSGKIRFLSSQSKEPIFELLSPSVCDSDAEGIQYTGYELSQIEDGEYLLSVSIPSEWCNKYIRTFPLCVDMYIIPSEEYEFTSYSWVNGAAFISNKHLVGLFGLGDSLQYYCRTYLKLRIPDSPGATPAKKVAIKIRFRKRNPMYDDLKIEMYKLKDNSAINKYDLSKNIDYIGEGRVEGEYYIFDFTEDYNKCFSNGIFEADYIFIDSKERCYMFDALIFMGTESMDSPEIIIYY